MGTMCRRSGTRWMQLARFIPVREETGESFFLSICLRQVGRRRGGRTAALLFREDKSLIDYTAGLALHRPLTRGVRIVDVPLRGKGSRVVLRSGISRRAGFPRHR